jgi:hypothetical protein
VYGGSPRNRVGFLAEATNLSLLHGVKTSSGTRPSPYLKDNNESEAEKSLSSSAAFEKSGAVPPLPHTSSWCGCLTKNRENFYPIVSSYRHQKIHNFSASFSES